MAKIVLTEDQFRKLLGHEIRKSAYIPLRKNAFTTNIFRQSLDEGMYKTYDIDFVVRHFCGYLGFSRDYEEFASNVDRYNGFITKVSGENGEEYIEFVCVDDPGFFRKADDAMKLCGYYKAFCEPYCNGYLQAGYEKRHDKEIELKTDKLYHITQRENLLKIKRNGLVPKAKDRKAHHLERVYFFTKDYGEEGFKNLADDLYKEHAGTFGYAVIEVDLNLVKNVSFHNDLNADDCVYTTDNISPDALKVKYQYKK